ncbi:DgyrCDS311 [Dimorphilus gyrociliatus]|uniref:GPI ethanolamine phosphate transferase 1 n=1 Tax=Dimorphilus gyrociliatus TaxID=2664684 RepID=A0A7I8V8L9_9ANNE|nr:DgyrCDS311 [Dimorphilus gyrociliatus]
MDLHSPKTSSPAKRLVLFVGDGLRADTFYIERQRSPYLRKIIEEKGSWGVSHTRVPTETRPGHVAMIAGFYEDVSSVAKGWKENAVEFDSVFNQSSYTFSFGSFDVVPMFENGVRDGHVKSFVYSEEIYDMAAENPYTLDLTVYNMIKEFLRNATTNSTLNKIVNRDKVVLFIHLLGIDTNGHAYKPHSRQYLDNINVVDDIIKKSVERIEEFYNNDKKTAYVFTADHGMTAWGTHGGGYPSETLTPLVAWGAGVKGPEKSNRKISVEESTWNLDNLVRKDVEQADVAALMAGLIGVNFPANSVGTLPVEYLSGSEKYIADAIFANAKQVSASFEVKMKEKQQTTFSMLFSPYKLLTPSILLNFHRRIIESFKSGNYNTTIKLSKDLIKLSLNGLLYYHHYDRFFLWACITLSFLGLLGYISIVILKNFSNLKAQKFDYTKKYKNLMLYNRILAGFLILITVWAYFNRASLTYQLLVISLFTILYNPAKQLLDGKLRVLWPITCISVAIFPLLPVVGISSQHYLVTSYEAIFFAIYSFLLILWIHVECQLAKIKNIERIHFSRSSISARNLEARDIRIAVAYLIFVTLGFFGIGNIASINSFDVTSTYCFTTILKPFIMGPLIFIKTVLPMLTATCAVYAIHVALSVPLKGLFALILFISDAMAVHFFFMIKDEGSWLDIGTSISHYVVVMTKVLALNLFMLLSKFLTSKHLLFSVGGQTKKSLNKKDF